MATYKTPNVYVEEISVLPPSVVAVSTAIPAFIGYTKKGGPADDESPKAVKISTLLEFESLFGGAPKMPFNVNAEIVQAENPDDPGNFLTVSKTVKNAEVDKEHANFQFKMYHSLRMFFDNGGSDCYIVSVGHYQDEEDNSTTIEIDKIKEDGLNALRLEDEPTLILSPDVTSLGFSAQASFYDKALQQCVQLKDRFTIMDVPAEDASAVFKVDKDAENFRNNVMKVSGVDSLKYGAAYYPDLETSLSHAYDDSAVMVRITTIDPEGISLEEPPVGLDTITDTELYNRVKTAIGNVSVILPPSGAIAGVYARVDNQRGVWKAPANVSLSSVIGPVIKISDKQQEDLNVHTTGKSINAIRSFTGKGILVWGARTLAGNDNEWRYVPVRRLFNFVEESIQKATAFAVFEPNTAMTWLKLETLTSSFLNNLWQQGALAGSSADQAYFVNVGLGSTMTAEDILEGRLIVEIGIAAVRPAEFIVLRFSHKLQEA